MDIKKFAKKHKKEIIICGAAAVGACATGVILWKLHYKSANVPTLGGDAIMRIGVAKELPSKVSMELFKKGAKASTGIAIDVMPETAMAMGNDLVEVGNAIKAGKILDRMYL